MRIFSMHVGLFATSDISLDLNITTCKHIPLALWLKRRTCDRDVPGSTPVAVIGKNCS